MLHRIYSLSPRARLIHSNGRRLLVCDYPLQQFELNESAWQVLSALQPGVALDDLVDGVTPALTDFLEVKATQGALQAEYRVTPPAVWPTVEVIIPVYANPAGLLRCLEGLARVDYPPERLRVTVVDDGSPMPVREALPGAAPSGLTVRWLWLEQNQGPASARNTALETPWPDAEGNASDLCAFIDSDCVPTPDWLRILAAALEEPSLAAVGGQVFGLRHDTWLARYEAECSSLNLGTQGGAAGEPGDRHPYLPSCNLLARREALTRVGGFRPGLRLGEDVDLCWRLRADGARLFYFPGGAVTHEHRDRLVAFLGRKRAYARSEAWLRRQHAQHFATGGLRGIRIVALLAVIGSLASWADALVVLITGLAAEASIHVGRRPRFAMRASVGAMALALLRRSGAGLAQVCRGALRATLVLWLPAVMLLPSLQPAFGVLLLLGGWAEWQSRRPKLRWWEFALGAFLDAFGYSVGKLEGMAKALAWRGRFLPLL